LIPSSGCLAASKQAAKFANTIREAVGNVDIPRPAKLQGLEDLPQKVQNVPNQAEAVKEIIRNVLG